MKSTKINVGIVGYGNLGKAVEKCIMAEKSLNLVAIFSRRQNIVSAFNTKIFNTNEIINFEKKIDVLLLCNGSQKDMLVDAPKFAHHFNIINTFDTHNIIAEQVNTIDKIAKSSKHFAIISAGWDPGLMSIMRAYFFAITNKMPTTLWGPGTSLGHSEAVRKIKNVKNAISLTIPTKAAQKQANLNSNVKVLHKRLVYVVCDNKNKNQIKNKIIKMPNYFAGQKVKVKFVRENALESKKSFKHAGKVFCGDNKTEFLEFCCKMQSNPMFTAKIVILYAKSINHLTRKYGCGAFTPLEFSPTDLLETNKFDTIKNFC